MNLIFLGLFLAATAMLSACAHTPPATGVAAAGPDEQARVPNEYLVRLAPGSDDRVISTHYSRFGIKYLHALEEETFLLVVSTDPGPREMEALIRDDSRIRLVQPNIIYWDYR